MDEENKMRLIIVFEIILLIVILVGEFFFLKWNLEIVQKKL